MKSERLLNAIGKIDDKMIEEAWETPIKKTDSRKRNKKYISNKWMKRLAVAACFFMVISVPVLAIEHGLRLRFMPSQHEWSVNIQGRFPIEAFSKKVLELADSLGEEDGIYTMNNFEEASQFLGIDLPDNEILGKMPQEQIEQTWSDGKQVAGNTMVHIINNHECDFIGAWTYSSYLYKGTKVWVNYQLITELNPYENGGGISMEINADESEQRMETYVTASGRECSIIYSGFGEYSNAAYAYMDIDGILTEVQIMHASSDNIEIIVKEVMDAYK